MTSHISSPTARPRQPWRRVDGVLLLDKPLGISSQAAVTRAKYLLLAAKAGHTGTLDPMASGLLPICFGEATKFSHMLLNSDKSYSAIVKLGVVTTTGDMEGEVTARADVRVAREEAESVLRHFQGDIMQTPPMYSALKHEGQPLYKHARAGRELTRAPRPVRIMKIELVGLERDELEIRVRCGKGTYIRVLAEDIGRALGCGACLAGLRRTAVGEFQLERGAVTLEDLQQLSRHEREALLLPVDVLVATLPRIDLGPVEMRQIITGQEVECPDAPDAELARIYGPGRGFLGVVEIRAPYRIAARRLMAQGPMPGLAGLKLRSGQTSIT